MPMISDALLAKFLRNALLPLENEIACGVFLNNEEVVEFVNLTKTSKEFERFVPMLQRECDFKFEVLITDCASLEPACHEITSETFARSKMI